VCFFFNPQLPGFVSLLPESLFLEKRVFFLRFFSQKLGKDLSFPHRSQRKKNSKDPPTNRIGTPRSPAGWHGADEARAFQPEVTAKAPENGWQVGRLSIVLVSFWGV